QFHAGVSALADRKIDVLLEVGPDPVLLGLSSRAMTGDGTLRVPSSRRQQPERETLLEALALLHGRGARIRWEATRRERRTPVLLPTAAFARQRHWLDAAHAASSDTAAAAPPTPSADTSASPGRYRVQWIPAPADDTGE